MKHHYNKEELVELKRKYDMQVSKEALEEINHRIDLDKEIERLNNIIKEAIEYCRNDNNFQIVEPYAQSMVKGIQRKILEILDKEKV